ncbi:MAG: phytanoyl-CoA dioxygenase family protein [Phycisphaeraceae bacterium]|nr:phytanoyl-CoA dioxygenase family protein [Phycisphaeraceae bacterium]
MTTRTYKLTDSQIQQFNRDGYVIVRGLFAGEYVEQLGRIARADREMDAAPGRKDAQGGVSRLRLRNELPHDIYSAFVRSQSIVGNVETLLGGEVYHFHHKMMLKEPRVGGAWEWHQDYGYWYKFNYCLWPDLASVMIAVDRANKDNGCLQVLAGSHHCGRIEHGETGEQTGANLERVEALKQRLPLVHVELEPGDTLFFHSNLLHSSAQNRSDNPRWTLICCYNTVRNNPYKPGYHPDSSYLERWPDEKILEVGAEQWKQMQEQLAPATA